VFIALTSKIEHIIESQSKGCDKHQDEYKDLYWFGPPECKNLRPVWVSIFFINLCEFDQRSRNGGLQTWEFLQEVVIHVARGLL
jgi:hypothetical protein